MLDFLFDSKRKSPLQIAGPPGVEARIDRLMRSFEYDFDCRFPLEYLEFKATQELRLGDFRLTPFDARHHAETRPHMLRVETKNRCVFFSGDTGWMESLPETVGECDLFICEATDFQEEFDLHLSIEKLQAERRRFTARRMVLTHLGRDVLENLDRVKFETASDGLMLQI